MEKERRATLAENEYVSRKIKEMERNNREIK